MDELKRPWLDGQMRRVNALAALESGWSGEPSEPPTESAAAVTRMLLCVISALHTVNPKLRPQLVPTIEGGIDIVWMEQGFDLEIEIEPDGKIGGYLRCNADKAEMTWGDADDRDQ